ncbi:MAG: hypothetical protein ACLRWQ_18425 [Flavonifractor plautii]
MRCVTDAGPDGGAAGSVAEAGHVVRAGPARPGCGGGGVGTSESLAGPPCCSPTRLEGYNELLQGPFLRRRSKRSPTTVKDLMMHSCWTRD